MRAHFVKSAVCGAILVLALACGSDSTAPRDVTGVYTLRTVNGSALPYTVPNSGGGTIVIQALTATLDDTSYVAIGTGTLSGADTTVLADSGLYVRDTGTQLNFGSGTIRGGAFFANAKTDTLVVTLPGGFLNSTNPTFSLVLVK